MSWKTYSLDPVTSNMTALVFEPRKKVTVEARYFEVQREIEKSSK